jgi:hypothetical protein
MISVYANQIRCTSPDPRGAVSMTIEQAAKMFEGDAQGAANALRAYPVGASVTVKHPKGQRSCMNKPALWAWTEGL